jgi:hypothetical protein
VKPRPEARQLLLTVNDHTAGLYDTRTLESILPLPAGVLPLALSSDGRRLAANLDARRLLVWDLAAVRRSLMDLGMDWEDPAPEPTGRFPDSGQGSQ